MSFMPAIMFLAKMVLLALIVETAMVIIFDVWGNQVGPTLDPKPGDQFNALGVLVQLKLYGHYLAGFILLAGVLGMIIQVFKPERQDMVIRRR